SPLCWGDSTPKFRSHLRGMTGGDHGTVHIFATNPPDDASPGLCGPLGRCSSGAAHTPRILTQKLSSGNAGYTHPVGSIVCAVLTPSSSDHGRRRAWNGLPLRGVVAVDQRGAGLVAERAERRQRVAHDGRVPEDLREHVAVH